MKKRLIYFGVWLILSIISFQTVLASSPGQQNTIYDLLNSIESLHGYSGYRFVVPDDSSTQLIKNLAGLSSKLNLIGEATITETELNQLPENQKNNLLHITKNPQQYGLAGTKIKLSRDNDVSILYITSSDENSLINEINILSAYNNYITLLGYDCVSVYGTSINPCSSGIVGSGTLQDPYQITNCQQLQSIKNNLSAYYILVTDIDCSETRNWNNGQGFEPMGNLTKKFTGSLDGDGRKVSSLYINRNNIHFVGLFGYVSSGANIKNLGLENVNINGKNFVGSLVGISVGTNIKIDSCYAKGTVTGNLSVGGLAGTPNNEIKNSYFVGNVNGITSVGGLVGTLQLEAAKVINSYSIASVSGNSDVGGLVGRSVAGDIYNSFAAGNISASSNKACLVFRYGTHDIVISNSYCFSPPGNTIPCTNFQASTVSCTPIQDKDHFKGNVYPTKEPFAKWDFTNFWQEKTNSYPVLKAFESYGTCYDRMQNQDETTVDCGGVCGLCCSDNDQDGYSTDGGSCQMDCDDTNPAINPGKTEICNDIDDNCDGAVDEGCYPCYDTFKDKGLLAYWTFYQGTPKDYCDGNDLTPYGTIPQKGIVNTAMEFNGVNNYLIKNDFSKTAYTNKLSVLAWVKRLGSDGNNFFVTTQDANSGGGFSLYHDNTDYKAIVKDNGAWASCYATSNTGFIEDFGQWVHLAMVYDGSTLRLYRNGIEISYDGCSGGNIQFPTTANYMIGGLGTSGFVNGILDEVALFNRALSSSEINNMYNLGVQGKDYFSSSLFEPVCGNNYIEASEECDDGNMLNNDGCSSSCLIECTDNDGDGYSVGRGNCGEIDCNDNDPYIHPLASEICDGKDNDCNPLTLDGSSDSWYNQQTECGLGICSGNKGILVCQNGQRINTCNPIQGSTQENCDTETGYDGLDNNCDGAIDLSCNSYCDQDGDNYTTHFVCLFAGYKSGDCDDSNANINPAATEMCDKLDNNCNEVIDEGCNIITCSKTKLTALHTGTGCVSTNCGKLAPAGLYIYKSCSKVGTRYQEVCIDTGSITYTGTSCKTCPTGFVRLSCNRVGTTKTYQTVCKSPTPPQTVSCSVNPVCAIGYIVTGTKSC